jgi:phage protein D
MSFFADTIEREPQIGFYVPDFLIEVEGKPLDPTTKGDVLSIKLTLEVEKIASATVKLNNWNDQSREFKYSDSTGLDAGHRVRLKLGYVGKLVALLEGQINSLAPDFPEKGASTLTIGVLDKLQLLKDRSPADDDQRQFLKLTDGEIAKRIAKRNNLETDIDPGGVVRNEEVQAKRDDATFLMELARRNNFECYIYVDGNGKDKLRFGASALREEHKLEWGRSLRSFVPTLTLSGQYNKVTVRGWDQDKKEVLVGIADLESVKARLGKDSPEVSRISAAGRQEVVTGAELKSQEDANNQAHDLLMSRIKVFTTGKASLIGRADIRPGDTAHIAGVGKRFNGTYDVFKVEHMLDDKGFSTGIELRNHRPDRETAK